MPPSNDRRNAPITYRDAGVDIDAGNALVAAIGEAVKSTRRPGADAALGGFGGLFDLKAAGFVDPVLVAANDGVGTKLKIAIETGRHETIGIDLVAMCVNDLVVQGAEPLFFLDYFATAQLDVEVARAVVEGIAEGCRQAGCALIGGETAEMPGMYGAGDYDLAGFAVGAVERTGILPRRNLAEGDLILGLRSSGVHSNGYSLVRRIVADQGLAWDDTAPFDADRTLADALLEPTRIYVRPLLAALRSPAPDDSPIKALAHITGGGLLENLPRVLPPSIEANVDVGAWDLPPVFDWLKQSARLDDTEMLRTFNCGIGMVAVVSASAEAAVLSALAAADVEALMIGRIGGTAGAGSTDEITSQVRITGRLA